MRLSIIVAVAENGVIGRADGLPWRLSSDLKRFKTTTMGHPIIMGRKTYESIGRPLPGRTSVIVTRNLSFEADGCLVANDIGDAIRMASECESKKSDDAEAFIIGGRQIYEQTLELVDRLYWTWVCADPEGDTQFPDVNWKNWEQRSEQRFGADEKNEFETKYCVYDRTNE